VYALDFALPPTMPTPALVRQSVVATSVDHRRTLSSPTGEASKFIEQLWSDSEEQKQQLDENTNMGIVNPQSELKKKDHNKLRKKRVGSGQNSMEIDLEAQA
jgi:hypothetical protein